MVVARGGGWGAILYWVRGAEFLFEVTEDFWGQTGAQQSEFM